MCVAALEMPSNWCQKWGSSHNPFTHFHFCAIHLFILADDLLTNTTHTWRMAFTWPFLPFVSPHLCKSWKPNMYIFWEFVRYRPLPPFAALPEILDCPNSSSGTMACNQQIRQWVLIGTWVSHREPIPQAFEAESALAMFCLFIRHLWGAKEGCFNQARC